MDGWRGEEERNGGKISRDGREQDGDAYQPTSSSLILHFGLVMLRREKRKDPGSLAGVMATLFGKYLFFSS